ncbi:Hypothetical_protein [Hexamita inflata]|uniref:Hypothetical_protein n=1 Tax=Hexamita inflata TaxID=28002 RepID=A0AA86NQB6_9EUKA|nr:Hypothetical protein HINF_LOCUS11018 [Hexamita inflata]
MLFHSFEVATLSKLRYNFFINVESRTETISFCSYKHLQKDQFFIHLGLLIFQYWNYIALCILMYNIQAFYWFKLNSIIQNFTIFMKFCQDFIHSVLLTVTFVFTCNRIFDSPTNSIDFKQFILISTGPSHGRKGIHTRINQQDKTKSIPLGFVCGSSLPSKLQVETNRIPNSSTPPTLRTFCNRTSLKVLTTNMYLHQQLFFISVLYKLLIRPCSIDQFRVWFIYFQYINNG